MRAEMNCHSDPAAVLDRIEDQHQTIKVCVCGRGSCGKSRVIRLLTDQTTDQACQTLGLQVTTCWWKDDLDASARQGQAPSNSRFEFWEVGSAASCRDPSLLTAARHSAAVALLIISMTDRAGLSQVANHVAELQSTPCIIVVTKCDAMQSWAMALADVDQVAKDQNLPVCLVGLGSTFEAMDSKAQASSRPATCMKNALMSQILTAANASLW